MKLLRICASNYKNCCDNFMIDLTAQSRKSAEDKKYELKEITEGLYVYNTIAIVGENASGKTSAIELMAACYSILGQFRLKSTYYNYDHVALELVFYHEGSIYRYTTVLKSDPTLGSNVSFTREHLYRKNYSKTKVNDIFLPDGFTELTGLGALPEDVSILFFVLKKKAVRAIYSDCNGIRSDSYQALFQVMKTYGISSEILDKVIRIFDVNIGGLEAIDENLYRLTYKNKVMELNGEELAEVLSGGTTRGLLLYINMVAALENGLDLLIDELENHFHKSLAQNMIRLFKDPSVNRSHATLIFTTHNQELPELFQRQDNIYITKNEDEITIATLYQAGQTQPELLNSRQLCKHILDAAVKDEDLLSLKKVLIK